ncbi:ABC transporter ATP-binding protein [Cohnella faecalis]|uniref:ABC transporter ATP-binding protein n=1 Tax=Cohnella faecalis TaxID=2315694 RepID=A0A398CMT2_9BACL|nr:ABC transporter ATP-binding protein [Cohnella faecalis]RIE03550.1 ABC transporter ATP-binding protein [Cohnella faecalis]
MLQLENVVKSYTVEGKRQVRVLDIRSFGMAAGEKAALVGPSGSGKSTLLHLLSGIIRPTEGTIRLLDRRLETLAEAELDRFRACHIGYVFQSFNLLPGFTAIENVLAAMQFGSSALTGKEKKERAAELLDQVGLGHRLRHRPAQLSQGEQQRVSIARALANRPALVLADEPTASLDAANAGNVFELLANACKEEGAALLLCTHDSELAGRMDRIVRIRELSREGA